MAKSRDYFVDWRTHYFTFVTALHAVRLQPSCVFCRGA